MKRYSVHFKNQLKNLTTSLNLGSIPLFEFLVGNEIRLLNNYWYICIQDDDPEIDWKKRKGSSPAGYYLVTAPDVEGETGKDEIEYWPYQISEILHDLI